MSENIGRYNVIFEILTQQQGDIEKIKKEATGLTGVFNTAKGAFAGIVAAQAVQTAISSIGSIITSTIGIAAAAETSAQSFKTLLGSASEAKSLLAELNTFSIETPFEPAEIEASAKTLLGFGRASKDILSDIELIGNASAATGADLQGLATVFGQVAGIGKLGGQDALQFINQGIPIYQLLSESLGKTVGEVKKLQEQGKLTFDDLRNSFAKASEEGGKFAGALADQSKTYTGLISTFRGNVDEFLKTIGQAILPVIKPIVQSFADLFAELKTKFDDNKTLIVNAVQTIAGVIVPVFKAVGTAIGLSITALLAFFKVIVAIPEFVRENKSALLALGIAVVTFNAHLIVSNTLLLANTAATKAKLIWDKAAATTTGLLTLAQQGLNAAFRANPIGVVVTAVILLYTAFSELYKRSETVRQAVAGIIQVFSDFISYIKDGVKNIALIFSGGLTSGFSKIGETIFNKLKQEFTELFDAFGDIITGENIIGGFKKLVAKIIQYTPLGLFAKLGSSISDSFTKGFNNAKEPNIPRGGKRNYEGFGKLLEENKKKEVEDKTQKSSVEDAKNAKDKEEKEEKLRKERLQRQLDYFERQFANSEAAIRKERELREAAAIETIKDAKKLQDELENINTDTTKKLEINEIKKQQTLLSVRQNFINTDPETKPFKSIKDETDYKEIGNQLDELARKLKTLEPEVRKVDILDILPPDEMKEVIKQVDLLNNELATLVKEFNSVGDPRLKEQIKNQIETVNKEIQSFQSPKLNKLVFQTQGFDGIDIEKLAPEDQVSAAQDRLKVLQAALDNFKPKNFTELGIAKKYQAEADKIREILAELGIDITGQGRKTAEDYARELGGVLEGVGNIVKEAAITALHQEIETTDRSIRVQEDRVAKAESLAEKGKVKQLQIEEARLQELTEKREKYVQAQRVISQLEITQANAVAAAQSIKAITQAFATGGPAAIATGIATGVALAAQIALMISSVRNSFADIPAFREGVEVFSAKKDGRVSGPGTWKSDSVPAWLSNGERVVDAYTNYQMGSISNDELPDAVALYKAYPKLNTIPAPVVRMDADIKDLKSELIELRKSFEGLKIVTKIDMDGFTQNIERRFENVIRRKKAKG